MGHANDVKSKPFFLDRPVISEKTCESIDSKLEPIGRTYTAITTSKLWRHSVGRGSSFFKFLIHLAGIPVLTLKICYEHLLIPFAKLDDKETVSNLKNRLRKETAAATDTKKAGEAPKNCLGQPITEADFDGIIYHEKHLEQRINEDINALEDLSTKSWHAFKHVIIAPPIAYESLGMALASTINSCISGLDDKPGAKIVKAEAKSEENKIYQNARKGLHLTNPEDSITETGTDSEYTGYFTRTEQGTDYTTDEASEWSYGGK